MHEIPHLISQYGYQSLFLALFLEAIGVPIPGGLGVLVAGAAAATGTMSAPMILAVSVSAELLGDSLLFLGGRYAGWSLLGFLCRLSLNPETCILQSARAFYKRGRWALLVAKFIPGINTMAPPLAGSMNMRPSQFFLFDLGGALIYVSAFLVSGYVFSRLLEKIIHGLQSLGTLAEVAILIAVGAYACYRISVFRKNRGDRYAPRAEVGYIAAHLARENASPIIVADVRSHGYYDAGTHRIKGSIRIEPNNLETVMETLPRDKSIYLYCT